MLKRLSEQEKALACVGTTVVQAEQLLMDLELLDTQARVSRRRLTPSPPKELQRPQKPSGLMLCVC